MLVHRDLRGRALLLACAGLLVLALASPSLALAKRHTFRAVKVERGVATFRIHHLDAGSIRAGKVTWRRGSRSVRPGLLRRAARRGVLRVRIDRALRSPRIARASKLALIVTTRASRPRGTSTPGPTSVTAPPTGSAPLAPPPAGAYQVRGIYGRDSSPSGFDTLLGLGFKTIDVGPYADRIDALAAAGAKGFIWLGGYSNTTCTFNYTDDWVRSRVADVAGNPGVAAYFIDDEPNARACPSAPAQMKARSDLVKSIDPGPPTFLVDYKVDQLKLWAGTVDVLGLDHYPCTIKYGCDYSRIDAQAAEAERLGVRYWGVIQAYGDDWYKVPTADELHQQFVHWRATRMEGYLVFAWAWPRWDSSLQLANHPELQRQLAIENAESSHSSTARLSRTAATT